MNVDLVFGALAIAFGLFSLTMRFVSPEHPQVFRKLEPMRKAFGRGPGTAIHWASYTVFPLVAGAVMLYRGL